MVNLRFLLRLLRWASVLGFAVALTAWCVSRHEPRVRSPLELELLLPSGAPQLACPLIATGKKGAGDLLFVRYLDPNHIVFGYDSWGRPLIVGTVATEITPGRAVRLRVWMPSATLRRGDSIPMSDRLKVECNGRTVLDTTTGFYLSEPDQVVFGDNTVGSWWTNLQQLRGTLTTDTGRPLHGPVVGRTVRDPFANWCEDQPVQAAAVLLFTLGFGLLVHQIDPRRAAYAFLAWVRHLLGRHRPATLVIALAALIFAAAITNGTFHLFEWEFLSRFFDDQALSLLHGHLDVARENIWGEAFTVGGKVYGYFGLTPAILRMPFMAIDLGFGCWSRIYMLGYFVGSLVAAYFILREVARIVGGEDREPSRAAVVILLSHAGLGSTLLFLASRAMMYHEAILCGALFALWGTWYSLRQWRTPARRWWLGAIGCGFLAVHSRPPAGLFALCLIGTVLLAQAVRAIDPDTGRAADLRVRLKAVAMAALAAVAILTFNGVSYLKFGTFDGSPLRYNEQFTPARLARIDGKNFHRENIPFTFYSYVIRPNFRLDPRFPYFFVGARDGGWNFPHAKIDLVESLVGFPYAMAGLFALGTVGAAAAFVAFRNARVPLAILWIGATPMILAMFAAIAVAQRHTTDFCPLLIASAAFGLTAIDRAGPLWRIVLRGIAGALTLVAIGITFALVLDYQANWGPNYPADIQARYQKFFHRIDGFMSRQTH